MVYRTQQQVDTMRAEKTMGIRQTMKALYAHLEEWQHLNLGRGVGVIHIEYDLYNGVDSSTAETVEEIEQFDCRMLKVAAIKLRSDFIELILYRQIGNDPDTGRRIVGNEDRVRFILADPESLEGLFQRLYQYLVTLGYPCERPDF